MGLGWLVFLCLSPLAAAQSNAAAEFCTGDFTELDRSVILNEFKLLFDESKRLGLLNETEGSYVLVESVGDNLQVTLFSTGFFDLIPIRRRSEFKICEKSGSLTIETFGRREKLIITPERIVVGDGGAKYRFQISDMPPHLMRVHHFFWQ